MAIRCHSTERLSHPMVTNLSKADTVVTVETVGSAV